MASLVVEDKKLKSGETIETFLRKLDLSKYVDKFREQGYTSAKDFIQDVRFYSS